MGGGIKRYKIIFDLRKCLFNVDQNAEFSFVTYLRLTQFSCVEIGKFPDDFISLNEVGNFYTPRQAAFLTILPFNELRNFYTEIGASLDDLYLANK